MLQKQKNQLTISVLSRLKKKGPPEPQVPAFNPMGKTSPMDDVPEEGDEPVDGEGEQNEQEKLLQVMYPPRKKKRPLGEA